MDGGSPPHAWGKLCLISAMAPRITVHPHMRGENLDASFTKACKAGSPPHAWGKRSCGCFALGLIRFTPTCVGKTWDSVACCFAKYGSPPHAWGKLLGLSENTWHVSVHPHMRGENSLVGASGRSITPVHPHMRGENVCPRYGHATGCRFTPTCVGKTLGKYLPLPLKSVHPHMRGENFVSPSDIRRIVGSPPHAWGKP